MSQSRADGQPEGGPSALRVALLGTGYIADWHARALASVGGVELVAVCDKAEERARTFAVAHGVPRVYGSLEAMLAAERLSAVHVLLPPDLHCQSARAILEAGVDVFLEKPMCATAEECRALVELASARGRRLGVGHNFLFSGAYERLRRDVHDGRLGRVDHLTITWHNELPQATHGPFDTWMLREPGNIALEIGSHCVAQALDLLGPLGALRSRAENPITLPGGRRFHRRWRVEAEAGPAALDLRLSFVPGFGEYTVHVRGTLGAATADLHRETYALRRHGPRGDDLDRYAIAVSEARALRHQARTTLSRYLLSKLHLHARGSPYGSTIAGALDAFYAPGAAIDERIRGERGAEVIATCERLVRSAGIEEPSTTPAPPPASGPAPRVLVLGATGFIGRELVRQLVASGQRVRVLARSVSKLPDDLRGATVECLRGDLSSAADVARALGGIECVYHLARAAVKTWPDYQREDIEVTRGLAEAALAAGVKRFVYTGTIDSYYAGNPAETITEHTPLDPRIGSRNLYARAKATSEEILLQLHRERGLPLVILRPGIVVGRGGSPFHWGVGMWWHGSYCQVWGGGENKLPLVLVEDVASALVAAGTAPGVEGEAFNIVADPRLSAREYLDELDRSGEFKIPRSYTPIMRFYLADMFKWLVKVLVRHPGRRLPSYHDWNSRTQRATFDCSKAKERLGWRPESRREELVRRGISEPLQEALR